MAKYNEEIVKEICEKLANGCSKKQSAILCGIDETTFYDWVKTNSQFSQSVDRAIEEYKQKLINLVNVGSIKSPSIALEVLGRRFPDEWGEVRKLQLNDTSETLERMFRIFLGKAQEGDIIDDPSTGDGQPIPELSEGSQDKP